MALKKSILKIKRPRFFKPNFYFNQTINNPLFKLYFSQPSPLPSVSQRSQTKPFSGGIMNSNLFNNSSRLPFVREELITRSDYYIRIRRIRFKPGYPRM